MDKYLEQVSIIKFLFIHETQAAVLIAIALSFDEGLVES
jgi:hypothetical protein